MEDRPIEVDGSLGEGGGQILRTGLALSALTGKLLHVKNIRGSRPKPGLRPQHLASTKTMASICEAELKGAVPNSRELSFAPKRVKASNLKVNIGTAGSVTLLLQQVLPSALLQETRLLVSGGTNVPFSPPAEFLEHALFPVLNRAGARLGLKLIRRGYYPKGNGAVSFYSRPARLPLKPICLTGSPKPKSVTVFSHCASLPKRVAENQASSAKHALRELNLEFEEFIECRESSSTIGSGITLLAFSEDGFVLSGSALGRKGVPAEHVGREAAERLLEEISQGMPCGSHLADQLIPFMALAKGNSEIHTARLTGHCLTNISIAEKFLPASFRVDGAPGGPAKISVEGTAFTPER